MRARAPVRRVTGSLARASGGWSKLPCQHISAEAAKAAMDGNDEYESMLQNWGGGSSYPVTHDEFLLAITGGCERTSLDIVEKLRVSGNLCSRLWQLSQPKYGTPFLRRVNCDIRVAFDLPRYTVARKLLELGVPVRPYAATMPDRLHDIMLTPMAVAFRERLVLRRVLQSARKLLKSRLMLLLCILRQHGVHSDVACAIAVAAGMVKAQPR